MRAIALLLLSSLAACSAEEAPRARLQGSTHTSAPVASRSLSEDGRRCRGDHPRLVSGDHVLPQKTSGADPEFGQCEIEPGKVIIEYTVSERGDVVSAAAVAAPNECMSKVAISAIRLWKFCPGELRGEPMREHMSATFSVKGRR